jgi:hypothetical protein
VFKTSYKNRKDFLLNLKKILRKTQKESEVLKTRTTILTQLENRLALLTNYEYVLYFFNKPANLNIQINNLFFKEMNDENGRLRKVLAEKDYEISSLKKKLDDERSVLGSFNTDAAATKIVDLAKKVRELTAQLESEKTKNKQLTKTAKDLEEKYESMSEQNQKLKHKLNNVSLSNNQNKNLDKDDYDESDEENVEKKQSLTKENKELKEKLNQTCHKMMEYKSQCEILKQDLNKHKRVFELIRFITLFFTDFIQNKFNFGLKALEKEVGDNFDVKSIISGQGNWKGRQQTIRNLQSKLGELKQQIGMIDARSSQLMTNLDEDEFDENYIMNSSAIVGAKSAQMSIYSGISSSARTTTAHHLDHRHKNELRRIEKERKENYEVKHM